MKKIIALLLAVVMVLGLVACSSSADTAKDTTPAETTDNTPADTTDTCLLYTSPRPRDS